MSPEVLSRTTPMSAMPVYRLLVGMLGALLLAQALIVGYMLSGAAAIDADALRVNLAGRQRMLSQRVLRLAYEDAAALPAAGPAPDTGAAALDRAIAMFEQTLGAIESGGLVEDTAGNTVEIAAFEDPESLQILGDAIPTWIEYRNRIEAIRRGSGDPGRLASADVRQLSDRLLEQMNALTLVAERQARQHAENLRRFEHALIALVSLGFLVLIVIVVRTLKQGDRRALAAQRALLRASRRAGQRDAAIQMLHRAGNHANSVTVSLDLIADRVRRLPLKALERSVQRLDELVTDAEADSIDRALPAFQNRALAALDRDVDALRADVADARTAFQRVVADITDNDRLVDESLLVEDVRLGLLIDDALAMSGLGSHEAVVSVDVDPDVALVVDGFVVSSILASTLSVILAIIDADGDRVAIGSSYGEFGIVSVTIDVTAESGTLADIRACFAMDGNVPSSASLHDAANMAAQIRGALTVRSGTPADAAGDQLSVVLTLPQQASEGAAA